MPPPARASRWHSRGPPQGACRRSATRRAHTEWKSEVFRFGPEVIGSEIDRLTSVLILKSVSFYVFAARVRRQKRWMLARMSFAVLVQRKGFGSALVASM